MRPLLFAALLAACQTEAPPRVPGAITPEGEVVFTINGTLPIHQNMYDAVLERVPPEQRTRMAAAPGGLQRLEEQLSMSQLLYGKAIESGLADDPKVRVGLAMAERDYLAAIFVQREGEKAINDEAIAKRYEERKVQYARPEVKARHILVKEESKAVELKKQLDGGANFAELATANSEDPGSKEKGGDLGWFERRRMDPAFSEAAFTAEKGAIVGPVSTRFGFHLIQVEDKRDARPLDEVREEIAASLRQDAIQAMLSGLQAELTMQRPGQDPVKATPAPDMKGGKAMPTAIRRPEGSMPPGSAPPGATPSAPGAAPTTTEKPVGHP